MTLCDDPYTLLGISTSATPEEIRKAYLKAALQCHPDRNPNDTEATQKFQAISHAYTTLTDSGEHTQTDMGFTPHHSSSINLEHYKMMYEHLARQAETFYATYHEEVSAAKQMWSAFKTKFTSIVGDDTHGSDDESMEMQDDGFDGSDSEVSSTDSEIPAPKREKADPLLFTIQTTALARQMKEIQRVEYTRYRWNEAEQRAVAEQYTVLVPVEHDEMTFADEGDWIDPHQTVAGDVIVFVEEVL